MKIRASLGGLSFTDDADNTEDEMFIYCSSLPGNLDRLPIIQLHFHHVSKNRHTSSQLIRTRVFILPVCSSNSNSNSNLKFVIQSYFHRVSEKHTLSSGKLTSTLIFILLFVVQILFKFKLNHWNVLQLCQPKNHSHIVNW